MGRYYKGDIEGKFWFGIQNSDDASFFGGTQLEPTTITYNFDEIDLPDIIKGIEKCKKELGENKEKLDAFFSEGGKGSNGYNDEMLKDEGFTDVDYLLEWYARLELGEKILKCVKEKKFCEFDAEI